MKAVSVFPGTKTVKIVEHEAPRLSQPDQVMLRMLDIGICGTDREICFFEYGTPPQGYDYLVIGHEALAQVVEVGSAVNRLKAGDLVVPTVRRPCTHPECLACRSGHQDYCYTGDFTERGIKEAHGYMTEFVVDHERNMNLVPIDLREVAVLVEPLTIAEKAMAQVFWLARQPLFVSEDDYADDFLATFRHTGIHLALVLDESSQFIGLVTLEDLMEELVGEIQSEYQARDEQAFVQREDGSWLVDVMVALDGVWERIGIPTPRSEKPRNDTTLAELILAYLGHIPAVGDLVTIEDVTLEVVDMDGKRIDRVLISRQ